MATSVSSAAVTAAVFKANASAAAAAANAGKKTVLYKTEFCRSFEETGFCRYGTKCQFAHDMNELRQVSRHPRYKTEVCKTFWDLGHCPYGRRCCFIHCEKALDSPTHAAVLKGGSFVTFPSLPDSDSGEQVLASSFLEAANRSGILPSSQPKHQVTCVYYSDNKGKLNSAKSSFDSEIPSVTELIRESYQAPLLTPTFSWLNSLHSSRSLSDALLTENACQLKPLFQKHSDPSRNVDFCEFLDKKLAAISGGDEVCDVLSQKPDSLSVESSIFLKSPLTKSSTFKDKHDSCVEGASNKNLIKVAASDRMSSDGFLFSLSATMEDLENEFQKMSGQCNTEISSIDKCNDQFESRAPSHKNDDAVYRLLKLPVCEPNFAAETAPREIGNFFHGILCQDLNDCSDAITSVSNDWETLRPFASQKHSHGMLHASTESFGGKHFEASSPDAASGLEEADLLPFSLVQTCCLL